VHPWNAVNDLQIARDPPPVRDEYHDRSGFLEREAHASVPTVLSASDDSGGT
jgi:hypothetical protein